MKLDVVPEIVLKRLDEIKPYENNPRKVEEAIKYVRNSIHDFKFVNPIAVDENNVIINGHTRYYASKELQLEEVPCIVVDWLTPEKVKALRIADNKTSEKALWDYEKLIEELTTIDDDMTDYGFADFELKSLLEDTLPDGFDKEVIGNYDVDDEKLLKCKKIIITYEGEEQLEFLKNLLKVSELKIDNRCEEIMARYD